MWKFSPAKTNFQSSNFYVCKTKSLKIEKKKKKKILRKTLKFFVVSKGHVN